MKFSIRANNLECSAIQALRDAGEGGGFVLPTGDQCCRDTPEENLFALVETAKTYGIYDQQTGRLPALDKQTKQGD